MPGEQLTLWSSTQIPHIARFFLAVVLGIPESKIRVITPDVGGGFGGKLQFVAEEIIAVLVARRTADRDDSLDLGATVCRSWPRPTGSRASPFCAVLALVIWWIVRRG